MLERTYTVPLRKEILKKPKHKRAKKAVTALKQFLVRHMKAENPKNILIGENLNKKIWEHGIKNPPTKVTVTAQKDDNGLVRVELEGVKFVDKKKEKEEKKPETAMDKMKKMVGGKESRAAKAKEAKEEMKQKEKDVKDALGGKTEKTADKEEKPVKKSEEKPAEKNKKDSSKKQEK